MAWSRPPRRTRNIARKWNVTRNIARKWNVTRFFVCANEALREEGLSFWAIRNWLFVKRIPTLAMEARMGHPAF